MLSLIRRYKLISSFLLVAIFSVSFLSKDIHEIFVKHQYVSCSDHDDDSYLHYHTTKHSVDNCLICSFVLAPVLAIHIEAPLISELSTYISYNSFSPEVHTTSSLFSYLLRGPPSLAEFLKSKEFC